MGQVACIQREVGVSLPTQRAGRFVCGFRVSPLSRVVRVHLAYSTTTSQAKCLRRQAKKTADNHDSKDLREGPRPPAPAKKLSLKIASLIIQASAASEARAKPRLGTRMKPWKEEEPVERPERPTEMATSNSNSSKVCPVKYVGELEWCTVSLSATGRENTHAEHFNHTYHELLTIHRHRPYLP